MRGVPQWIAFRLVDAARELIGSQQPGRAPSLAGSGDDIGDRPPGRQRIFDPRSDRAGERNVSKSPASSEEET
ncbi:MULTISPECIES: hypothetical protein [unclassified Bradyrhizobium]|uniref:hypothetical protein n=1 Tax=unclassified Bradyrhizobium TaxID=2631580 RepID=UPI0024795BC3|nr:MULTISPECIES: hypothetical protein [unclassified Bradyrhizobium]WGS23273.1 hypothetical protein MTX22_17520 [Bradyrhizobium sp. ISRA463]WGS30280.1 hypothetical protein MTX19_15245 [Bradyrhizobium sp. ISRA464]